MDAGDNMAGKPSLNDSKNHWVPHIELGSIEDVNADTPPA